MKLSPLAPLLVFLASGSLARANPPAEPTSGQDRVTTDAAGRETSRVRTLPDGSTETVQMTWAGPLKRAVVSETRNASGQILHRRTERFDDKGRLSELRSVDVDAKGRERGSRKTYAYDAKGSPMEQAFPIE